ncbi:unnamed protein product [Closterium sp. NIES-53]
MRASAEISASSAALKANPFHKLFNPSWKQPRTRISCLSDNRGQHQEGEKRYLYVSVGGGLNQQRRGIANAVVVAKIMNVTLIVPKLIVHPAWGDQSKFSEIFSVPHFVQTLKKDVEVIEDVPASLKFSSLERLAAISLPSEALEPEWYIKNALPLLQKYGLVVFNYFFMQLQEDLPTPLQHLRCRAQYHALQFVSPILSMGLQAVQKLQSTGPYVAVHLRYEPDWIVHTGCLYDEATNAYMKKWASERNIQFRSNVTESELRKQAGLCPITPQETAHILKALGVDSMTTIYIAGGAMNDGARLMRPLHRAFPRHIATKDDLLEKTVNELVGRPSVLAAIDYIVCLHSDFFMMTAGGNMGMMLRGHRFYLGDFKETFQPYGPALVPALSGSRPNMTMLGDILAQQRMHKAQDPLDARRLLKFFDRPWECVCEKTPDHFMI